MEMNGKTWKTVGAAAITVCLLCGSGLAVFAAERVPGGEPVGIRVNLDGAMVADLGEVQTAQGAVSPAGEAGILPGDFIVKCGSRDIHNLADFNQAVAEQQGAPVTLTVERSGASKQVTVAPVRSETGTYQFGLWLRDCVTGLGTMTYYDPETGIYGALGHGINDAATGEPVSIQGGALYPAEVSGVIKGKSGAPGALCGGVTGNALCGTIAENTVFGIFGRYDGPMPENVETVLCGESGEAKPGPAEIVTTVDGTERQIFSVNIDRVFRENGEERFLMTVTDRQLLEKTGGIVQGMSGSPILQNGKLIGAVTHVLTDNPQRGYGLGIQKMLETAEKLLETQAAA